MAGADATPKRNRRGRNNNKNAGAKNSNGGAGSKAAGDGRPRKGSRDGGDIVGGEGSNSNNNNNNEKRHYHQHNTYNSDANNNGHGHGNHHQHHHAPNNNQQRHHNHTAHRHHAHKKPAALMTVIINRVDLYDGAVAAKVARDEMEAAAAAAGTDPQQQQQQQVNSAMSAGQRAAMDEAEAELMAAAQAAMAAGLGGGPPQQQQQQAQQMLPHPMQQHQMVTPMHPHQAMHPMPPYHMPPPHPMNPNMMPMMPPQHPGDPTLSGHGGNSMHPQHPHPQMMPHPNMMMMMGGPPPPGGGMMVPPGGMPPGPGYVDQYGRPMPPPQPQQQPQPQSNHPSASPSPKSQPSSTDPTPPASHGYPAVSRYYFRAASTATASSIGDGDYYYSCVSDADQAGDVSDRGATSEPVPPEHGGTEDGGEATAPAGGKGGVAVVRAPHLTHTEQSCCVNLSRCSGAHSHYCTPNPYGALPGCEMVVDNITPNPHPTWAVHNKYWSQRRRLFSKFDCGIQLDSEGWYSVTPEIIADHVAARFAELSAAFAARGCGSRLPFMNGGGQQYGNDPLGLLGGPGPDDAGNTSGVNVDISNGGGGLVMLDAFCGCGGNSIAFGKLPSTYVSQVVCVDIDRNKLRNAAHNAALYGIPPDKLIFIECNTLRVLEGCYRHGRRADPSDSGYSREPNLSAAAVERVEGFLIGGEDLLPPHIDAVFMDPPWGGVDYGTCGKHGYDLEKNMKIIRDKGTNDDNDASLARTNSVRKLSGASSCEEDLLGPEEQDPDANSGGLDAFFDAFDTGPAPKVSRKLAAKTMSQTMRDLANEDWVDGVELLKIAAEATRSRMVLYDLPKNTNKESLGRAALAAGYCGNIRLEEHFLNGRLKTVTAYLGTDFSELLN